MKKLALVFLSFTITGSSYTMEHNPTETPTTAAMQKDQREFDTQFFDKAYCKNDQDFEKLRHILLHLMKTVGKIASYCEIKEHGKPADPDELTNAALPDLYLHALQIANLLQVDLGEKYQERIAFLVERNTTSSQNPDTTNHNS